MTARADAPVRPGTPPARSGRRFAASLAALRSPACWLLLVLVVVEFFLFDRFGSHRHTAIYPRWNDQIQYLGESYSGYEYARAHGLVAGLSNALTNPSAQGTLHDFLAILVFTVTGPSRSAALALNMIALVAWQLALFAAAARTSGSRALAFAAALLPLALAGPWRNIPGSAYDFRLDHLALCTIGIAAAAALLADGFRSRRGSFWFGVAVGLAVMTRFLTGTYFGVVFAGLALWIAAGDERATRFRHLARAAAAAAACAGPFLWLNFDAVRDYYWIGHYVGPESVIRNQHLSLARSISFVATQLAQRHLGLLFGALAIGGTVALALLRRGGERPPVRRDAWVVGAIFLLAPALVLTLHPQKSEVVVSALAPGAVILTLAAWQTAARRAGRGALVVFATGAAGVVLLVFARAQFSPAFPPAALAELRQVNTLADHIFARTRAVGRNDPKVAVDYITDALDAQVLRIVVYERHRALLPFEMTLPTSIAEPDAGVVRERLARSDFVFVTEEGPVDGFPYDRKLAGMRAELRAWCETHLRPAETFTLGGRRMRLYQKPEFPLP